MIEVCREVFQWPKYVNTAAFVASLISFIILIILDLTNNKLIARIKICCCTYSRNDKKCHTSKRIPLPLRIENKRFCGCNNMLICTRYNFYSDKITTLYIRMILLGTVPYTSIHTSMYNIYITYQNQCNGKFQLLFLHHFCL